jgi:HEAT repeat protein
MSHQSLLLHDHSRLELQVRKRIMHLGVDPPGIGKLTKICGDKRRSEYERCEACELLGLLELVGAFERRERLQVARTLLENFKEDSVKLSWCSAVALGYLKGRITIRPLLQVVRGSMASEMRRAAIHSLGLLGNPRAATVIIHVLENPKEPPEVRAEAAEALATCGRSSKRAVAALTRALMDESVEVRFFSSFALGQCALLGGLISDPAISALRRLLKDSSILRGFGSVADEAGKALRQIRSSSPLSKRAIAGRQVSK